MSTDKKILPSVIAGTFPLLEFIFAWTISERWQQFSINPVDSLLALCLYMLFAVLTVLPFWQMYTASKRNKHVRRGFYSSALGGLIANAAIWSAIAYDAYIDYTQPLTSDPAGKALSLMAMFFSPLCVWFLMQVILIISLRFYKQK